MRIVAIVAKGEWYVVEDKEKPACCVPPGATEAAKQQTSDGDYSAGWGVAQSTIVESSFVHDCLNPGSIGAFTFPSDESTMIEIKPRT